MIEAKELKWKNLIYIPSTDQVAEVDVINPLADAVCVNKNLLFPLSFKDIEPIPLTEEWLLKFGFENKSNFKYSDGSVDWINVFLLNDYLIKSAEGSLYGVCKMRLNSIESVIKSNLQYVHELQNLYHSMTGKELQLKESKN